ncbi:response regulator transcription factor [Algibacter pacificus]|uniref:response regulator transcription factor n=1 Tax=Algibacter pacificus TaxID=2599389 RepID=UPI0011CC723F|nr:response regulator transcription factor [Algibacter pacificus]
MKILIVEDDLVLRQVLEYNLQNADNVITLATDGGDALEKIKLDTPDLVITDVMMPFVSGLELVTWIKENYQDQIKIIVLTSLGQEDVVLEAFSLGVDDFLTKPFDPKELALRIKRFK